MASDARSSSAAIALRCVSGGTRADEVCAARLGAVASVVGDAQRVHVGQTCPFGIGIGMALMPATAAAITATREIFILDSAVPLGGHNGWRNCVLAAVDSRLQVGK